MKQGLQVLLRSCLRPASRGINLDVATAKVRGGPLSILGGLRRSFAGVRFLTGIVTLMWLTALHGALSAQEGRVGDLPDGEGQETVIRICGDCHSVEKIPSPRRSRAEWQELVEEMAARNGVATADDIYTIVHYVVASFGRVNVNRASEDDLVEIVQLTASEASAIVEFQKRQGDYHTLDDLRKVPGLDFARIQERKDRIGFTGP